MKYRMNIMLVAVLAILAGLVWNMTRDRDAAIKVVAAPPLRAIDAPQQPKVEVVIVAAPQPATQPLPVADPPVRDKVTGATENRGANHIAQPGETVASLANDLLGKDTKTNRDAIINANSSLKADPDKLLAGNTYRIPSAADVREAKAVQATAEPAAAILPPTVRETTRAIPAKELKYVALPGDTVIKMAQAFLGSDDKTNQDAIINANPSLRADPDHVVAGATYRIPVPDGLSAAAVSPQTSAHPATQPDADQVLLASSPRELRYTARAGDTVTTLAIQLLGSDTQETRDAIINNNPTLKRDPDRVIAGQTYWIPAPTAEVRPD